MTSCLKIIRRSLSCIVIVAIAFTSFTIFSCQPALAYNSQHQQTLDTKRK